MNADNHDMFDADLILRAAFAQHQAGDLVAACELYTQVIKTRPSDHDALHLLGLSRAALGCPVEGIALVQRAIVVNPANPAPHFNLGGLLWPTGNPIWR